MEIRHTPTHIYLYFQTHHDQGSDRDPDSPALLDVDERACREGNDCL